MKTHFLKLTLFLVATTWAHAEDNTSLVDTPAPSGPLLGRAPIHCAWTVTFTYGEPVAAKGGAPVPPPGPRPVTTTITKTDHFYHEVTLDSANKKTERWTDGQIEVFMAPGQTSPTIEALMNRETYDAQLIDYNKVEFTGLEWVSGKTYVGMIKRNSRDYMVFRQGNDKTGKLAYVDLATRLPVSYKDAEVTQTFTFVDINFTSQNFSDVVQRIFEQQAKVAKKLGGYGDRP